MSDSLEVGGSYTLLTGAYSLAGGSFLTCEKLFHRCHTRVYQKKRFIIVGDKRKAGESVMSLALEEGEKALSEVVE
jgi:hypothetical protein